MASQDSNITGWITVGGRRVPLRNGESKKEAVSKAMGKTVKKGEGGGSGKGKADTVKGKKTKAEGKMIKAYLDQDSDKYEKASKKYAKRYGAKAAHKAQNKAIDKSLDDKGYQAKASAEDRRVTRREYGRKERPGLSTAQRERKAPERKPAKKDSSANWAEIFEKRRSGSLDELKRRY